LFWIVGLSLGLTALLTARPVIEAGLRRVDRTWKRALAGPPVPASTTSQMVGPGLPRRALLLHDGVAVSERPGGGQTVETLGRRMWVDVYDTWPVGGRKPATHVRIGNRRPFGWVPVADLLAWDTRLVVTPRAATIDLADSPGGAARAVPVAAGMPLPVVGWKDDAIQVAVWSPDAPWERIETRGWVRTEGPSWERGVLLSRQEVVGLLRHGLAGNPGTKSGRELRARAVTGRVLDRDAMPASQVDAIAGLLPAWVWSDRSGNPPSASRLDTLTRLNEAWKPQIGWSGLEFQAVPVSEL
jgi:hypothetical protein